MPEGNIARGARLLQEADQLIAEARNILVPLANVVCKTGDIEAIRHLASRLPKMENVAPPFGFLRFELEKVAGQLESHRLTKEQIKDIDFGW